MPRGLRERLVATVVDHHPRKAFGYLISDVDERHPVDWILFESNVRNADGWKQEFESWGRYFVQHSDAGFVATPEESWRVQQQIWERGMFEVGVFHSHQRHPANFSRIDYEMHLRRFPTLWHLIVSLRNPALPQLRAFSVSPGGVCEIELVESERAAA
jgi:proteasome lid subunit RPN8/RPN11